MGLYLLLLILFFNQPSKAMEYPKVMASLKIQLSTLLQIYHGSPEKYELLFDSWKMLDFLITPTSSAMRYILLNNYTNGLIKYYYPFKYIMPFHIIITKAKQFDTNPFTMYAKHSTTLVVVTVFEVLKESGVKIDRHLFPVQRNSPALKVLLYAQIVNETVRIQYSVVCNGYCIVPANAGILNSESVIKFVEPTLMHKFYFRFGNGRQINLLFDAWANEYLRYIRLDPLICEKFVLKSTYFRLCDKNIMSSLLVSKHHNMSFTQLNKNDKNVMKTIDTTASGQYILMDTRYLDDNSNADDHYRQYTGILFSEYKTAEFLYCQSSKHDMHEQTVRFSTWVNPLTLDTWLLIAISVPSITFISSLQKKVNASFMRKLLDTFGAFLGNSVAFYFGNVKLFVALRYLGMLVCITYGNGILSILTAPARPAKFVKLEEMLSAGYKIIWEYKQQQHPWMVFKHDFKERNLLESFNSSFEILSIPMSYQQHANKLLGKYVKIVDNFFKVTWLLVYKSIIVNNLGQKDVECYILPDVLANIPYFFEFYTVNRVWLMETYNRIVEGGLTKKWDYWSSLAYRKYKKISIEDPNPNKLVPGDQIEFPDILAINILMVILFVLSFIYFIIELTLGSRKGNK